MAVLNKIMYYEVFSISLSRKKKFLALILSTKIVRKVECHDIYPFSQACDTLTYSPSPVLTTASTRRPRGSHQDAVCTHHKSGPLAWTVNCRVQPDTLMPVTRCRSQDDPPTSTSGTRQCAGTCHIRALDLSLILVSPAKKRRLLLCSQAACAVLENAPADGN